MFRNLYKSVKYSQWNGSDYNFVRVKILHLVETCLECTSDIRPCKDHDLIQRPVDIQTMVLWSEASCYFESVCSGRHPILELGCWILDARILYGLRPPEKK